VDTKDTFSFCTAAVTEGRGGTLTAPLRGLPLVSTIANPPNREAADQLRFCSKKLTIVSSYLQSCCDRSQGLLRDHSL
jgi:hypothetical protein